MNFPFSRVTNLLLAMAYDFIILVLAAYPLWPERGYGGISTLLLRDGIVSIISTRW
jgi:hypothetical protein